MSKLGIGYITEDRKNEGIIKNLNIKNNITLGKLNNFSKLGFIIKKLENTAVKNVVKDVDLKFTNLQQLITQLSGGNQQKVIVAKWLISKNIKILIMDEPTRGIDVGAKYEIYHLISKLCSKGISIIMISSELQEIIGICNRVLVMRKGEIMGELLKDNLTEKNLLGLAIL